MNFTYSLLFVLICVFCTELSSQNIMIYEDDDIKTLMQQYKNWNTAEEDMEAWCIQVITTDDRRKMEQTINRFHGYFPYIHRVKWRQISPYYQVRAGAFESKLKALAFLQEVKKYFPSAIPVRQKIKKEDLLELK